MTRPWDRHLQTLIDSLQGHFEVQELDLPESPVFVAVAIPSDKSTTGLRPRLPAGRGLTAAQAMLSAAAESIELMAGLAQNCDRNQSRFKMTNGLAEVEMQNISSRQTMFMSAQRVYLDWALVFNEPLIHDADSNGCATGNTWAEAFDRALLEIIERDAVAIWWYGRQRRRHLSVSCLDRLAPRLSWWLSHRQKQFCLIDVISEFGIPVVVAISHDKNGRHIAMGSASAVDVGRAAIAAVTEMIQMEVSMKMGTPGGELQNWFDRASTKDMVQFQPGLELADDTMAQNDPQQQLIECGHDIFAIDLTRKGDLLLTARVVVPALSALHRTPDIERIISQSLRQPQFSGIQNASQIETLEPY